MLRLALNVGTAIKQHKRTLLRRHNACDCRTLDTLDALDDKGCTDNNCACAASRNKSIALTLDKCIHTHGK